MVRRADRKSGGWGGCQRLTCGNLITVFLLKNLFLNFLYGNGRYVLNDEIRAVSSNFIATVFVLWKFLALASIVEDDELGVGSPGNPLLVYFIEDIAHVVVVLECIP